MKNVCHMYLLA